MSDLNSYRPFVRWWWFGGALERGEIDYQLRQMEASGIGGVEIQPVYPLGTGKGNEPKNAEWLSPEFMDMLRFTIERAGQLGLTVDLTLGSGWPFGGPHISKEDAAMRLRCDHWDLQTGQSWSSGDYPLESDEQSISIVALPFDGEFLDISRSVDLPLEGEARWEAVEGAWRVLRYATSYTRQRVKRPTVGAEGWVADHFSKRAISKHLREVGDRLAEAAAGRVRCYFSDSWEVFGSNWTDDFMAEFRQRRGYELKPYLPALDNYIPEFSPGIRYDYYRTLSDLALENYIAAMGDWCHENGSYSRVQAHGTTPGDIIRFYGETDIPECETGGWADGPNIGRTPKLASSAAHLYGRREVSCETFTHLRRPRFQVNLRMMKVAADRIFCHGVNHLVYHGYSYSPRYLGSPGWVFYASTMVNHNNSWWSYLKHLNRRACTISRELQRGQSTADVLVYSSLADVWCKKGMQRRPSTSSLLSTQMGKLPEIIWGLGLDFDVVNDHMLSRSRVRDAKIEISNLSYSMMVVPKLDFVDLVGMKKIRDIVSAGGKVVFLGHLPNHCPTSPREGGPDLDCILKSIVSESEIEPVVSECGLREILREAVEPDVLLPVSDPEICFIHRRCNDEDIYLLCNSGSRGKSMDISFRVNDLVPFEVDIEDGSAEEACVYYRDSGRTVVNLVFDPYGSHLLSFRDRREGPHLASADLERPERSGPRMLARAYRHGTYAARDSEGDVHEFLVGDLPEEVRISPWRLTVPGVLEKSAISLRSWTEIEGLSDYSGEGIYESEFVLSREYVRPEIGLELDLGDVREVASVWVNGVNAGDLWMQPFTIEIGDLVVEGLNNLKIQVKNLLINQVLGSDLPDYSHVIEKYGQRFPDPKEKMAGNKAPSGLLGPVSAKPYARITILETGT